MAFAIQYPLLLSDEHDLVYWLATCLSWIPLLVVVGFAVILLVIILRILRRHWAQWLFVWMPYAIVGYWLYSAFEHGNWDHREIPSIKTVLSDHLLWYVHIPLFLAIPILIIVHFNLYRKWNKAYSL